MSNVKKFLISTGMVALSMIVIFFVAKRFLPDQFKQYLSIA